MLYSSCTWYCKTRMVQYQLVGSCCFCLCKPVHVWVVNAQNNQGTVPKSLQLLSSWLQNNFSTVPRRLAVAAFRSAKHAHGTVPAGWQLCFCLCKAVHFWAVNALRILSELPESLGPSRKVHNQTVYSWICYCKARYGSQQIATAELIIAKLPQYNTTWFTFFAFGTAKHVWSPHGTLPTRLQLLRLPFACITVHLIYGQQMHLEYDHN